MLNKIVYSLISLVIMVTLFFNGEGNLSYRPSLIIIISSLIALIGYTSIIFYEDSPMLKMISNGTMVFLILLGIIGYMMTV